MIVLTNNVTKPSGSKMREIRDKIFHLIDVSRGGRWLIDEYLNMLARQSDG